MPTTIDESLHHRILQAPDDDYHVIVRVDCNSEEFARKCEVKGITVHRTFTLLPALAVTARGLSLLTLADDPHVTRIEPDREVEAR